MSAKNFSRDNAQNYYVIHSTYMGEDENGNEVEIQRDEWDYDCLKEDIYYYAKETYGGYDLVEGYGGNRNYPAAKVCEKDTLCESFGTKKPWFLEVGITPTILMRSGYYSGTNLDYEIKMEDAYGNSVELSDCTGVADMVDTMLCHLEEMVEYHGIDEKWNLGTFKLQKKNIEKWLTDRLTQMIDECEDICQTMCDETYVCVGVFSNGEAIYEKANTLRAKVCNIEK